MGMPCGGRPAPYGPEAVEAAREAERINLADPQRQPGSRIASMLAAALDAVLEPVRRAEVEEPHAAADGSAAS